MKTVVVGMSGGVDSSVTAWLLKEQGYNVIGLYMKNWDESDEHCPSAEDAADVALVAQQIGIPFYTVDFQQDYWQQVFEPTLEVLKRGDTPNPDVWCNQFIKFDVFYKKAMELGADYLATGHYCRVGRRDGKAVLLTGVDGNKDQSYFLHTVKSEVLERVLFPLGELPKPEVRRIAQEQGLATATKKDSTGICFVGKRDFKGFLQQYLPQVPGDFQTLEGKRVGQHDGCAFYTIGQRKGLGIGGPGEAWFVCGKNTQQNIVYVVQGEQHPALWRERLTAHECQWVAGSPPQQRFKCTAKIRYRCSSVPVEAEIGDDGSLSLQFEAAQKAITPGQSVVLYDNDVCLGGGIITGSSRCLLDSL